MKYINFCSVVLATIILNGCAPKANKLASNLENASIGMTKQDVIKTMGSPESVSAINNIEVLRYELCSRQMTFAEGPAVGECLKWTKYYVRLTNGKVDSYGELGDFDSTKDKKNIIDINLKN